MPRSAGRDDVRRLREEGAQVVEVLPRAEYEWRHVEGSVNLPLKELDAESARRLDPGRPVVVYCNDFQ